MEIIKPKNPDTHYASKHELYRDITRPAVVTEPLSDTAGLPTVDQEPDQEDDESMYGDIIFRVVKWLLVSAAWSLVK